MYRWALLHIYRMLIPNMFLTGKAWKDSRALCRRFHLMSDLKELQSEWERCVVVGSAALWLVEGSGYQMLINQ